MHAIKTQINKKYVTKGGIPVTVVRADLRSIQLLCGHASLQPRKNI